jgi:hypothetical protein
MKEDVIDNTIELITNLDTFTINELRETIPYTKWQMLGAVNTLIADNVIELVEQSENIFEKRYRKI